MFDRLKFNKHYKLISDVINNKEAIKELLNDESLIDFYNETKHNLSNLITYLREIYSKEKLETITIELIKNKSKHKIEKLEERIKIIIKLSKEYHGNTDPIKDIDLELVKDTSIERLELKTLDICFDYDCKETLRIKDIDIKEIYKNIDSLELKKQLYLLLKKGNLDLLVEMMNKLNGKVSFDDMKLMFKEEIDDCIYSKELQESIPEDTYIKVIDYFFHKANDDDRNLIILLIKAKNYELLKEMFKLVNDYNRLSSFMDYTEVDKDLCSLKKLNGSKKDNLTHLIRKNFMNTDINFEYFYTLRLYLFDYYPDEFEKNFGEYKDIIEFFEKLKWDNINRLSIEDKRSLYEKSKTITESQRQEYSQKAKEINDKVIKLFKDIYSREINKGSNIIDKATERDVEDKNKMKHRLKVYDLKDEEPFTFLITVMHHWVRDKSQNMYNRPSHKMTIEDPSNFTKDLPNGSEIISTSMISDYHIDTFVGPEPDVMYIFSKLDDEDVVHISSDDAHTTPKISEIEELFAKDAMGPRSLVVNTRYDDYNEIAIRRKKLNGEKQMPTAILCFDRVNDASIKHAEYFGIPIIIIHTKTYRNLRHYTPDVDKNKIL